MKRLFLIAACLVLIASQAKSMMLIGGRPITSSPSCTTADDTELYVPTGQAVDTTSTAVWSAQKTTLGSQSMITSYLAVMCASNSSGSSTILLMGHDAVNDYPDETNEIANTDKNIAATSIDSCYPLTEHSFDLATPTLVNAGTYWVVHKEVGSSMFISKDTSSSGERFCLSNDSGSNWTCTNDNSINIEVWGCTN